jgi:hypothetical protein
MKMVAQWRTASAKNYEIVFGIFVPVNAPARQPRDRQRGGAQEGFRLHLTQRSAEANLASGKRVENFVPYRTELDFICSVLEDAGLDGEFARRGRLSARHS